ncbi:MAG: TetR/AcrR family transcriptional regulator [bacterium]
MARPETKKKDVVNAALALFMKNGIKATTTRDIALRAGISEGTIYRHFDSKDELARIIFEQNLEQFWKSLRQNLRNCKDAEQMLRAYVDGYFEFARRHQRRYSFIIAAHQTELKRLSREKIKPMRMLVKILRLGQTQELFRESNPNLTAAMIVGTLTQTIFYMKSGQIAVNYKQVVKETTDACLRIAQNKEVSK